MYMHNDQLNAKKRGSKQEMHQRLDKLDCDLCNFWGRVATRRHCNEAGEVEYAARQQTAEVCLHPVSVDVVKVAK